MYHYPTGGQSSVDSSLMLKREASANANTAMSSSSTSTYGYEEYSNSSHHSSMPTSGATSAYSASYSYSAVPATAQPQPQTQPQTSANPTQITSASSSMSLNPYGATAHPSSTNGTDSYSTMNSVPTNLPDANGLTRSYSAHSHLSNSAPVPFASASTQPPHVSTPLASSSSSSSSSLTGHPASTSIFSASDVAICSIVHDSILPQNPSFYYPPTGPALSTIVNSSFYHEYARCQRCSYLFDYCDKTARAYQNQSSALRFIYQFVSSNPHTDYHYDPNNPNNLPNVAIQIFLQNGGPVTDTVVGYVKSLAEYCANYGSQSHTQNSATSASATSASAQQLSQGTPASIPSAQTSVGHTQYSTGNSHYPDHTMSQTHLQAHMQQQQSHQHQHSHSAYATPAASPTANGMNASLPTTAMNSQALTHYPASLPSSLHAEPTHNGLHHHSMHAAYPQHSLSSSASSNGATLGMSVTGNPSSAVAQPGFGPTASAEDDAAHALYRCANISFSSDLPCDERPLSIPSSNGRQAWLCAFISFDNSSSYWAHFPGRSGRWIGKIDEYLLTLVHIPPASAVHPQHRYRNVLLRAARTNEEHLNAVQRTFTLMSRQRQDLDECLRQVYQDYRSKVTGTLKNTLTKELQDTYYDLRAIMRVMYPNEIEMEEKSDFVGRATNTPVAPLSASLSNSNAVSVSASSAAAASSRRSSRDSDRDDRAKERERDRERDRDKVREQDRQRGRDRDSRRSRDRSRGRSRDRFRSDRSASPIPRSGKTSPTPLAGSSLSSAASSASSSSAPGGTPTLGGAYLRNPYRFEQNHLHEHHRYQQFNIPFSCDANVAAGFVCTLYQDTAVTRGDMRNSSSYLRFTYFIFVCSPRLTPMVTALLGRKGLGLTDMRTYGHFSTFVPRAHECKQGDEYMNVLMQSFDEKDLVIAKRYVELIREHNGSIAEAVLHLCFEFAHRPGCGHLTKWLTRYPETAKKYFPKADDDTPVIWTGPRHVFEDKTAPAEVKLDDSVTSIVDLKDSLSRLEINPPACSSYSAAGISGIPFELYSTVADEPRMYQEAYRTIASPIIRDAVLYYERRNFPFSSNSRLRSIIFDISDPPAPEYLAAQRDHEIELPSVYSYFAFASIRNTTQSAHNALGRNGRHAQSTREHGFVHLSFPEPHFCKESHRFRIVLLRSKSKWRLETGQYLIEALDRSEDFVGVLQALLSTFRSEEESARKQREHKRTQGFANDNDNRIVDDWRAKVNYMSVWLEKFRDLEGQLRRNRNKNSKHSRSRSR